MRELTRFTDIYEASLDRIFLALKMIGETQFKAVPVDSEANYLGARVNSITIENLLRHLLMAEKHWFRTIAETSFADVIPMPASAISDGDFRLSEAEIFYKNEVLPELTKVKKLTDKQLGDEVEFNHFRYSKMGFLWTLLTHQNYHFGQMDLLMRQQNIVAPEFMETYGDRVLIA